MSALIQALKWGGGFDAAPTPLAVGRALRDALRPFGVRGFFAGSFLSGAWLPRNQVAAGRRRYAQFSPLGWLDEYHRLGLDSGNPVIYAPACRHSAFRWSDPGFDDLRNWRGLSVSRDWGIEDGLAVACHEAGGRVGVVSIGFERLDFRRVSFAP